MKHNWHKKHFLNAYKILKAHPLYFISAPIAAFVGFGALIDSVIYLTNIISTALGLSGISNYLPDSHALLSSLLLSQYLEFDQRLVVVLIILLVCFFGIVAQSIVIFSAYNASYRKVPAFKFAKDGYLRILPAIGLNVLSFVLLTSVSYGMYLFITSIPGSDSIFVWLPLLIVNALFLLYILTAKMIALQLSVGSRVPVVKAAIDSVRMISKSPLYVIEHNVILFVVNVLITVVVIVVGKLVATPFLILGFWLSDIYNNAIIVSSIANIAQVALSLLLIGLLTAYNLTVWARVTRSLEKRSLGMALRHVADRYLP